MQLLSSTIVNVTAVGVIIRLGLMLLKHTALLGKGPWTAVHTSLKKCKIKNKCTCSIVQKIQIIFPLVQGKCLPSLKISRKLINKIFLSWGETLFLRRTEYLQNCNLLCCCWRWIYNLLEICACLLRYSESVQMESHLCRNFWHKCITCAGYTANLNFFLLLLFNPSW